jgi:hypothetical protein
MPLSAKAIFDQSCPALVFNSLAIDLRLPG